MACFFGNIFAAGVEQCYVVVECSAFEVDRDRLTCPSLKGVLARFAFFEGSPLLEDGKGGEFWAIDIAQI